MSKKTTEDILEELAIEGAAAMKAYLAYQGSNPEYLKKAKIGAVGVGSYTRIVAALTNRMAVQLMVERQGLPTGKGRKALGAGDDHDERPSKRVS